MCLLKTRHLNLIRPTKRVDVFGASWRYIGVLLHERSYVNTDIDLAKAVVGSIIWQISAHLRMRYWHVRSCVPKTAIFCPLPLRKREHSVIWKVKLFCNISTIYTMWRLCCLEECGKVSTLPWKHISSPFLVEIWRFLSFILWFCLFCVKHKTFVIISILPLNILASDIGLYKRVYLKIVGLTLTLPK